MVGDREALLVDYWQIAAALCRAFKDDRDDPLFWLVVFELNKVYPQYDWANTMTDQWPLQET